MSFLRILGFGESPTRYLRMIRDLKNVPWMSFELHLKEHLSLSRVPPVLSLTRVSAMSIEQKHTEKTQPKYPRPSFPFNQTECWEDWEGCQGHCFLIGHCSVSKQSSRGSYYRRDNRHFSSIKSALLSIFSRLVV